MITIICGTNRPNSNSLKVAQFYSEQLKLKGIECNSFSLEDLPQDLLNSNAYSGEVHEGLDKIQEEILKKATKFIFILPEYNGSFPGILKAFIDASDIVGCWHNKKACLVGIAAGRAGNLRGMEHFTNILNHIRINVLHLKVPLSGIGNLLNESGEITDGETVDLIHQQIDLFNQF